MRTLKLISFLSAFSFFFLIGCESGSSGGTSDGGETGDSTQTGDTTQTDQSSDDLSDQTYGVDVSSNNGVINWEAAREYQIQFAYARASEGITLQDEKFSENRSGMQEAGITWGAYHFFYAGDPAEKQFDNFVGVVGDDAGDLPPMLDREVAGLDTDTDISVEDYQTEALSLLQLMEEKYGKRPIIYTSSNFGNQSYLDNDEFAEYTLWVADYPGGMNSYPPSGEPIVPSPWKDKGWAIWQFSDEGSFPNMSSGPYDMDYFKGSLEELKNLQ